MKTNKKTNSAKIIFNRFSINFVTILVAIILIALTICTLFIRANFRNTTYTDYNEGIYYTINFIPTILIGIILLTSIFYLVYNISKKLNIKIILIISLSLVTIFSLFWVNFVQAPVKADQKFVLAAAISFKNGDYSFLDEGGYLFLHPLQLGIVFFLEFLINIFFTSSPLLIQNLNILFTIISFYILYKITKLIYKNEEINKMLLIIFPSFLVLPMLCVMVYGNIFGFAFSLIAIYLLLLYYKDRKVKYLLIACFSLIFSIILKSNYEIIMIAFIISLILDCIQKFDKKNLLIVLLTLVLFVFSNKAIIKYAELRTGKEISDGTPMISYIAMGIQKPATRNAGWYNEGKNVEAIYNDNNYNTEAAKAESIEIIKNRLEEFISSPKTFIKFYADKILSTWCEPAFQGIWSAEPLDEFENSSSEYQNYIQNNKILQSIFHGKLHTFITYYLNIFEVLVFAMSSVSTIYNIKLKKFTEQNFILLLSFLGGFLFHILWETKCIYVIPFYFLLLPSAACGFKIVFELVNKKLNIEKN